MCGQLNWMVIRKEGRLSVWKSVRVELEDDVGGGNSNACVSER